MHVKKLTHFDRKKCTDIVRTSLRLQKNNDCWQNFDRLYALIIVKVCWDGMLNVANIDKELQQWVRVV